jgi:hypothetical protein
MTFLMLPNKACSNTCKRTTKRISRKERLNLDVLIELANDIPLQAVLANMEGRFLYEM